MMFTRSSVFSGLCFLAAACGGDAGKTTAMKNPPIANPTCLQKDLVLDLTYAASAVPSDGNLLVAAHMGEASAPTTHSASARATRIEFHNEEKPCFTLSVNLAGERPVAGKVYRVGSGSAEIQFEEPHRCRDLEASKIWVGQSGSLTFLKVDENALEAKLTAKMNPSPTLMGAVGAFELEATFNSNCFVETK